MRSGRTKVLKLILQYSCHSSESNVNWTCSGLLTRTSSAGGEGWMFVTGKNDVCCCDCWFLLYKQTKRELSKHLTKSIKTK